MFKPIMYKIQGVNESTVELSNKYNHGFKQQYFGTKIKGIDNRSGQEIYTEYEICTPIAGKVDLEIKESIPKK